MSQPGLNSKRDFIIPQLLNHLPLVPHICVIESDQIGSDNGLSPIRRQAIIWTSVGLLSIRPLRTNFNEIQDFSFTTMHLKISSVKLQPFCPGKDGLKASPVWLLICRLRNINQTWGLILVNQEMITPRNTYFYLFQCVHIWISY